MRQKDKDRLSRLNPLSAPRSESDTSTIPRPESTVDPSDPKPRPSLLQGRQDVVRAVGSGKQRMVKVFMHPPERIALWEDHNRNYELLSSERCGDLIEGFKRTGKQEFPAIVRRVTDNPDIDFEVICGARRHWTATHLGWELLIEVRELNDRQAFILQDIENRDREDVSDYERACDYAKALPKYFNGKQVEMASFLEIDRSNFNRLLDLAKLPKVIVEAYGDLRDLKTHHGVIYKKLLADAPRKRALLNKGKELAGRDLAGKTVLAELKRAGQTPIEPQAQQCFGALTLLQQKKDSVSLSLELPTAWNEAARSQLMKEWTELLAELQHKSREG